ncbi:DUF4062 domain-containing protein [Mucilaginibacter celer]|uniref:DUF4062 domain-containing protein n=1 Tax=Mucilaginibacter celer TaxID=2305508 RepID=A0A494W041_9SPHI|nr:DUF4062 domain-containing protein [Mucilaginibacter celer]AYL99110.1 DUF4062 domain-containing protein [Mucilaginibacter celer]
MPKKIYISSTYQDLAEYRKAAENALKFLKPYFEVGRIMEYMMPGSPERPLEQCLKDVAACNIYILLIGKKYGSMAEDTGLSFTENEYNEAYNEKDPSKRKTIISLIAEEDAVGLKDIPVDDRDRFDRFCNVIKDRHIIFNFRNTDHLGSQLTLALFPYAEKKWVLSNEVILKCDRKDQYSEMYGTFLTMKNQLNVFAAVCKPNDNPEDFMQRMARIEYGFKKISVIEPLQANFLLSAGPLIENMRERFLLHIMPPLWRQKNKGFKINLEALLSNGVEELFLYFKLSPKEVANATLISYITPLLMELQDACAQSKFSFFLTFIIEFQKSTNIDQSVMDKLDPDNRFNISKLIPFDKVTASQIRAWLENHVTESVVKIQEIEKKVFNKNEYTMTDFISKTDDITQYLD